MSQNSKAVISALTANTLIAISKYIVAFLTMSSTMLAEAIHSTADCLNQILLLIGDKRSRKAPDETHAFGYGKEEYFWSMLVAVILFSLGSVFAIYEGIDKTLNPREVEHIEYVFVLLFFAIILEGKAFLVAYKEIRHKIKDTFFNTLKRATDTSLLVILVEDSSAMVGLIMAMLFTGLSLVHPVFDGIGSIFIGLILGYMSYFLANELRKLIIGENVSREIRNDIKDIIYEYDIVDHINYIRSMYIGRNKFLLNISIDVNDDKRSGDIEGIIYNMKNDIEIKYPGAEYITIEISDSKHVN